MQNAIRKALSVTAVPAVYNTAGVLSVMGIILITLKVLFGIDLVNW